jgi:hypothetical protein
MARKIEDIRKLFPYSDDCVEMQKTIDKIINEKSFYALRLDSNELSVLDARLSEINNFFAKKNCQIVVGDKKLEQVNEIANKYKEIDKIRIEAESKSEVKKRIYIGIGILLVATSIILISNKK